MLDDGEVFGAFAAALGVSNVHPTRVNARKRHVEIYRRAHVQREITIGVGRAQQAFGGFKLVGSIVVPFFGRAIAAVLPRKSGLQLRPRSKRYLTFEVQPKHRCAVRVVAFFHTCTINNDVVGQLSRGKHVVQTGVETLDKQVGLHRSKAFIEVGRCTETVRTLFFQVLGEGNLHAVAIRNLGVQVFVEGLRSPKTACVCKAEVGVGRGIVARFPSFSCSLGPKRLSEYQVRNKVVLV